MTRRDRPPRSRRLRPRDAGHPVLQREDLAPAAREPQDASLEEGFGGWYPGPVVERESASARMPVSGGPGAAPDDGPTHPALPDEAGGWESPAEHDLRREGPAQEPAGGAEPGPDSGNA